jgi:hypothetical protein
MNEHWVELLARAEERRQRERIGAVAAIVPFPIDAR